MEIIKNSKKGERANIHLFYACKFMALSWGGGEVTFRHDDITCGKRNVNSPNREFSRVVTYHVLQQYIRVTFRLCPFLPNLRGRLD